MRTPALVAGVVLLVVVGTTLWSRRNADEVAAPPASTAVPVVSAAPGSAPTTSSVSVGPVRTRTDITTGVWKTWYGDAVVSRGSSGLEVRKGRSEQLAATTSLGVGATAAGHHYRLRGRLSRGDRFFGVVAFYDAKGKPMGQVPLLIDSGEATRAGATVGPADTARSTTKARPSTATTSAGETSGLAVGAVFAVPRGALTTVVGVAVAKVPATTLSGFVVEDVTPDAVLRSLPSTTTAPLAPTTTVPPTLADLTVRSRTDLLQANDARGVGEWATWHGDGVVTVVDTKVNASLVAGEANASVIVRSPAVLAGHVYQLRGALSSAAASASGGTLQFYDATGRPVGAAATIAIAAASDPRVALQVVAPAGASSAAIGVYRLGVEFGVDTLELADVSTDAEVLAAETAGAAALPEVTLAPAAGTRSELSLMRPSAGVGRWKSWYGSSPLTAGPDSVRAGRGRNGDASLTLSLREPVVQSGHRYRLTGAFRSDVPGPHGGVVAFYDATGKPAGALVPLLLLTRPADGFAWEGLVPGGATSVVIGLYGRSGADWTLEGASLADVSSDADLARVVPTTAPAPTLPTPTAPVTAPAPTIDARLTAIATVDLAGDPRALGVGAWTKWSGSSKVTTARGAVQVGAQRNGDASASLLVRAPAFRGGHTYQFVGSMVARGCSSRSGVIVFYSVDFRELESRQLAFASSKDGARISFQGAAPDDARAAIIGIACKAGPFQLAQVRLRDVTSASELDRLSRLVPDTAAPAPGTNTAGTNTAGTNTAGTTAAAVGGAGGASSTTAVPTGGPVSASTTTLPSVATTTLSVPTLPERASSSEVDLVAPQISDREPWKVWFGDATVENDSNGLHVTRRGDKTLSAFTSVRVPLLIPKGEYQLVGTIDGPLGDATTVTVIFYDINGTQTGSKVDVVVAPAGITSSRILGQFTVPDDARYMTVGMHRTGVERFNVPQLLLRALDAP